MAFDPDQYLKEKLSNSPSGGFNPDKYLAEKIGKSVNTEPEISPLQSVGEGVGAGVTAGLLPIIGGAANTAMQTVTGISPLSSLMDTYRTQRDLIKKREAKAEEANPGHYLAGNLAGGLPLAALSGGSSLGAEAPLAAKLAQGVETGAAYGAAQGLGQGDADLTKGEVAKTLGQVATGATVGGLTGGVLEGALSGIGAGQDKLGDVANLEALRAAGIPKAQNKYLLSQGRSSDVGQQLLDNGIISPLASTEDVLERSKILKSKSGNEIGDVLGKLDNSFNNENPQIQKAFYNPQTTVEQIEDQLVNPLKDENGDIYPMAEGKMGTINQVIDTLNRFGNNPISFEKVQELRNILKGGINDKSDTETQQLLRTVRKIFSDDVNDSAESVANKTNQPELAEQLQKANETYGAAAEAVKGSTSKVAGNLTNRKLGLPELLSTIAGTTAGGPIGGLAAAGASLVAKKYGNSLSATTLKTLSQLNPEGMSSLGETLTSKGGEVFPRLGRMMVEASKRDDIGRNALMFSLMQIPIYREELNSLMGNKQDFASSGRDESLSKKTNPGQ